MIAKTDETESWTVTSGLKVAQHFIATVQHGGGSVTLGLLEGLLWWMEPWILPSTKNPEGERPAILAAAAGQWSKIQQQIHLWMAEEKQNEDFGVA